jgi:hypothetical protein
MWKILLLSRVVAKFKHVTHNQLFNSKLLQITDVVRIVPLVEPNLQIMPMSNEIVEPLKHVRTIFSI